MFCVYCIENSVNGCKYVGSTSNFSKRKISHFSHLNKGTHSNSKLQEEYNLWGEDCFSIYPLEECEQSILGTLEERYIERFKDNCYNIYPHCYTFTHKDKAKISLKCKGEKNGNYGRQHTDEEKQLCRDRRYGKGYICKPVTTKYIPKTEEEKLESRKRVAEFMRNRVVSEGTRRKLSEYRKGKHFECSVIAGMKTNRKGAKNSNCKLTKEQVLDIHSKMKQGIHYQKICSEYSIGQTQAYKIKRGEHWALNG